MLGRFAGGILDNDASLVLDQVISQLEATSQNSKSTSQPCTWAFAISPRRPLRFVKSEDEGRVQPDIFCRLLGPGTLGWPHESQELVIRIWSVDQTLSYRPELDAKSIEDWLTLQREPHRVILRLHFDRANKGQNGTIFHLQVGGNPIEDQKEKSWSCGLPDLPRIPIPPMDLILACELIIANFFQDEFKKLCKDPEWCAVVRRAEQRTIKRYFDRCSVHLNDTRTKHTLLKTLWNKPLT